MDLLFHYSHIAELRRHGELDFSNCTMERKTDVAIRVKGLLSTSLPDGRMYASEVNMPIITFKSYYNSFTKYMHNSIEIAKSNDREYCLIYAKIPDRDNTFLKVTFSISEARRVIDEHNYETTSFFYQSNEERDFLIIGVAERIQI